MASLVILSGDQAGTQFVLANRPLAGGRDPSRDIQIVDPKVSRRHFQIRKAGSYHVILELRSLNGVYVNGERIKGEQILVDGDQISVGDTVLAYYVSDDPDKTNAVNRYKQADRHVREDRTLNG
ncbi:MAG: FHA domain-containing protein [Phycisphaerae bacterium]|nr:FHA domain-containing protein [Phycisphaerae bacterium]